MLLEGRNPSILNYIRDVINYLYELAKQSLSAILDRSTQYYGLVRNSEASSGANVDTCIKVYNRKVDNTQGKNLKFVINLYNTSSTMGVNGSRVDLYIADISVYHLYTEYLPLKPNTPIYKLSG